ncbi:MAG: hypothetical protein V4747_11400 [Pseudomonadota bacterium]
MTKISPKAVDTPAAQWREDGQPDPHGDRYDCPRSALPKGHLTDDELANGIFMVSRYDLSLIGFQDAAKERIRWLSRQLAQLQAAPAQAVKTPCGECRIEQDETCDICGAQGPSPMVMARTAPPPPSPAPSTPLVQDHRKQRPAPAVDVAEGIASYLSDNPESGFWRSCTGCHETEDGHDVGHYPYSRALKCKLGGGCSECGGLGAVWDNLDYSLVNENPAPAVDVAAYIQSIFARAEAAREKAQRKFPQPNYVALKVAEEAGEVVRAAVHFAEGRLPWEDLEAEAVQTIAMIMRLLVEGDEVNGIIPPAILSASGGAV